MFSHQILKQDFYTRSHISLYGVHLPPQPLRFDTLIASILNAFLHISIAAFSNFTEKGKLGLIRDSMLLLSFLQTLCVSYSADMK